MLPHLVPVTAKFEGQGRRSCAQDEKLFSELFVLKWSVRSRVRVI